MSDFFKSLNTALLQAHFSLPTLVIEQSCLDNNIAQLKRMLTPKVQPRIVVKSLAAIELIRYAATQLSCDRFMIFHQPHLALILDAFPHCNILLGKPMPIRAVQNFYEQNPDLVDKPIQWLIDSIERLQQYLRLAQSRQMQLLINIEIDIGLHRGGIKDISAYKTLLKMIEAHPQQLQLSGLMGYDAHVGKIPKIIKTAAQSYQKSQCCYRSFINNLQRDFPMLYRSDLCFNGAGSPTLSMHSEHSVCNDLSFGSMLLKPIDFDLPTLARFQPAIWIATPVLKKIASTQIPELSVLDRLYRQKQAVFVYGGNWMAQYIYPDGARPNALYGRSSNQELVNIPKSSDIQIDDFVFLRLTQSESVISQFEQVWLHHKGRFSAWNTFHA